MVIIVRNEESNIRDCLESVTWADEIIIVDSGSSDNTVNICKEYTNKISVSDWLGFGRQKNKALSLASESWILSIDADERVSSALQNEIQQTINRNSTSAGFYIPRSSSFCGRIMRYSGWSPDYVLRLFRRDQGRFSDDMVHEKVLLQGSSGTLKHPLLHYPMKTPEQAIEKMNLYTSLYAESRFNAGTNSSLGKAVVRGLWTFFRCYILQRGFLDGAEGFMLAISNAEGTYYKYAKLAQLNRMERKK